GGPLPGRGSARAGGPGRAVLPDLARVNVTVVGVDAEPRLGRVRAALGVRAGATPVRVRHGLEELGRGRPGRLEGAERGLPRALLVSEVPGVLRLVVSLDDRVILDEEPPEPDPGDRL